MKKNFESAPLEEPNLQTYDGREEVDLWHGSPKDVDKLQPPSETGEIRLGEEARRGFRDVIFTTTDFDKARQYAGAEGIIYQVRIRKDDTIWYKKIASETLNPKKVGSVGDDIYVAMPDDLTIVAKWRLTPRNKNEPQKYDFEHLDPEEKDEESDTSHSPEK